MGNAYSNASLLVTPNGYRAGRIFSAKPTNGSADLSFSRASTALRRNSAGLWESVANNVPRLNYPVGGGCPSWLFEPQATNVQPYSNEPDQWTNNLNITFNLNSASSPFSGLNADKIIADNTNSVHAARYASLITTSPAIMSIYAKASGYNKIAIRQGSTGDFAVFNASNGTLIYNSGAVSTNIVAELNGWYRFSVVFTTTTPQLQVYILPDAYTNEDVGSYLWSGNATDGVLIIGAQVETGSVATSPIITAGSAVTRVADNPQAKAAPTNLQDFSLIMKGISLRDITETNTLFGDLTGGDSAVYLSGSFVIFSASGSGDTNCGAITIANNTPFNIGIVRSGSSVKVFKDGALISTTTATSTNFILDGFWAYNLSALHLLKGSCKDCELYEVAISNTEANNLTA